MMLRLQDLAVLSILFCYAHTMRLSSYYDIKTKIAQESPKQYDVMILEADLKTPQLCQKSKWSSNQATETEAYGYWFCKGSVLGRLVDKDYFANQKAHFVHYVVKSEARCRERDLESPPNYDVYIFLGDSRKAGIVEEDDVRAISSEFVQAAITAVETEAYSSCLKQTPPLNVTKWGWQTLAGLDFRV
ncbi:hypothetical protein GE061_003234 [Apolygus lucorum]|uniref:Uncharacterized protein n=1 Tax=Apolygus lucorum TaxID=248454 RepID=A0A6A4JTB3_APOLU|nr:hypothetical protein GE061_003234 [Apolygus lucorum]